MDKYTLMDYGLRIVMTTIKTKKGFQKRMTTQGHLSHHLFSLKNSVRDISLEHAIRMLVNYALNCSHTEKRNEFLEEWMQLGIYIQNFVDSEHIDKFNDLFISPRMLSTRTSDFAR